ncbi:MAG: response regulator [Kofleriaceae bacterium]
MEVLKEPRVVRRVLVIDDDELVLKGWDRALRAEGKHVVVATELDKELELEPDLDLAVVDLCLARGVCGIEMIRQIKRAVPRVHAVLVSAAMSIPQAVRAVQAGADDCASKPITPRELLRRVEQGVPMTSELMTLDEVQWEHISRALADCKGNLSQAARALGIHRQSLQRKLRQRRA